MLLMTLAHVNRKGAFSRVRSKILFAFLALIAALVLAVPMRSDDAANHVFGNPAVWIWPPTRTYHVENYKLTLHFDESQGEVFGDELITLRPFEPNFRKFYLDSSELKIDSVTLEDAGARAAKLIYSVDDPKLWITLDHDYGTKTAINVRIVYHAFPRTGLFFVNPSASYPNWPREVFSQGEPELNHFWFPCWDYPNDMSTSETITTVPEGQTVVSNGRLVKVTHSAGQATYDWVESVPHSSYLISLAIGPWHRFAGHYKDKPVEYYVPDTIDEATALRTFHLTPDMIDFFSRATGVVYPYEKYAQTTVKNFIFGGQENVSATTLTETTLHDARADQDFPSTILVAHELGQHWFGDYVQGRDWADIWLNEGFATYLTALYTQHHEGYDAYRFEMYQDQFTAQEEDQESYRRPIVDHHYADPLDMLDVTTHRKGAAVLDMLRYVVDGSQAASQPASQNEILFRALNHYLVAHHAQSADTSELEQSIRETTGRELGWFFREWVYLSGWPEYKVAASYDAATHAEKITVLQSQQTNSETPVFDMPIEFAFYGANGERKKVQVRDYLARQEFDFPLTFEPQWVDFDPDNFIYKTVEFPKPLRALIAEAEKDPSMMSRLWAAQQLQMAALGDSDARGAALARVLEGDAFYGVRAAAAASLGKIATDKAKSALLSALQQSDSRVRPAAAAALGNFSNEPTVYAALLTALQNDSSYAVEAAAARGLGKSGMPQAFDILREEVAKNPELHVMQGTLAGLVETKDPRAVEILLAQAQPGVAERVRLSALTDLESVKAEVKPGQMPELAEAVKSALHDPFYLTRDAGEELVGVYQLTQFESEIQAEAQGAPMAMMRDAAKQVLIQLHSPK